MQGLDRAPLLPGALCRIHSVGVPVRDSIGEREAHVRTFIQFVPEILYEAQQP